MPMPDAGSLQQAALTLAEVSPAVRYPAGLPDMTQAEVGQIAAATRQSLTRSDYGPNVGPWII